jgi:hypothetical protein
MSDDKHYSSSSTTSSKAVKTLGPELAGPKAMLVLGANPLRDREAVEKADKSLKLELERQQKRRSSSGFLLKSSPKPESRLLNEDADSVHSLSERSQGSHE